MKARTNIPTVALIWLMICLQCHAQERLADDAELAETRTEIPRLKAAAEYVMKDNTVEIELSQYAGYSGLVVANNGLDATEESFFFKKYGFKVKLTLSEEESWSALNSGALAASATTVDVLAVYGSQFKIVVPALIGFSRGADGVVVQKDIKQINDLRGKTLATSQFTEADFFIRYLSQEAGIFIKMLNDLSDPPDPKKINLVYCADAFGAGDLFLRDLKAKRTRLAGCVTWAPKTNEVAGGSDGNAHVLVTSSNLLIVADIMVVNAAFAKGKPKIIQALVEGLLEGNSMIRKNQDSHLKVIGETFDWDADECKAQLAKVHLANLPENEAFFNGTIDSAGSFDYIYETAALVYGEKLIGKPPGSERFVDLSAVSSLTKSGAFKGETISIAPIRAEGSGNVEATQEDIAAALLSKDISFEFAANSTKPNLTSEVNKKGLDSISKLLKVSPGSTILLRGHADGVRMTEFRKRKDFEAAGGEAEVRKGLLRLKQLSKDRCVSLKTLLEQEYKVDGSRIKIEGVGMAEPTGLGSEKDRRVEVRWFTVE